MSDGGHIIISSIEHNSVARPVYALSKNKNVYYSIAPAYDDDGRFLESLKSLIRHDTKLVVCTIAGNVTGRIMPVREIAEICRKIISALLPTERRHAVFLTSVCQTE